jgi:hypothetical protein
LYQKGDAGKPVRRSVIGWPGIRNYVMLKSREVTVMQSNNRLTASFMVPVLVIAACLTLAAGCVSMTPDSKADGPPTSTGGASYKVIFGTQNGKKPEIYTGQLAGNITVQDALEAAGAVDRFKGMTVDLARRLENGQVLKMPVNYDDASGRVQEEQNYAIHPGDEILVRRNDPGMLQPVFRDLKVLF